MIKSAFYDDPHFNYKTYWLSRQYEDQAEKIALRRLFKQIPRKNSLLDIGGGFGRFVPEYGKIFKHCLLIDPSEKLLKEARNLCQKYKNLSLKKGFIEKLPVDDKSFDVVISVRTFHHLGDLQKAIREISRVSKTKGFFILEFANKIRFKNVLKAIMTGNLKFFSDHKPVDIKSKRNSTHFFNYHPNHIKTILLGNGFKIIKVLPVSNFRLPWVKKIIPISILVNLESRISLIFSHLPYLRFFGPSIFVLCQKQ